MHECMRDSLSRALRQVVRGNPGPPLIELGVYSEPNVT